MVHFFLSHLKRFRKDQDGVAAVEFSLLALTFIFIIGVVVDFGHYLYLRQVLTNASREGARYGSVYGNPRISGTEIQNYIQQKFGPIVGASENNPLRVNADGAGGTAGQDLTVTVSGDKSWFFLDCFIDHLGVAENLRHPSGMTVMKLE
jgi:Flp pilus assembly protein TadG